MSPGGRPPVLDASERLTIRMPRTLVRDIAAIAAATGEPISSAIRRVAEIGLATLKGDPAAQEQIRAVEREARSVVESLQRISK